MTSRIHVGALLLAALLIGGCKDRQITAYRAPKDPAPAMPPMQAQASGQMPADHPPVDRSQLPADHPPIGGGGQMPGASMANTPVPTGGSQLTWTAPAHWTAKQASSMRKGTFVIKGDDGHDAELAISAFPGDTGGLHPNLNRWRGQIGLAPAADAELDAALMHIDGAGLHFELIDIAGQPNGTPTRMLGAILSRPGETWFFKLTGPDALVAREKTAFIDFLKTVKAP